MKKGFSESRTTGRRLRFNPKDAYLFAFFIPVAVMLVIFAAREIFPFGNESFLRTDMYHQYAPFFSEFQHKLQNGGSLLYSWDIGLGVNFAALYAYYLASPLNWLVILVPKAYILEFMTYMIVVKAGLSGTAMTWYLRHSLKTNDMGAAVFGIFYALSGYMAAYSWNIMWLDCVLIFPLIVFGLERLVREKRGLMYAATLGISILSNYYISLMICIFMVIYFIALQILEKPSCIKEFLGRCVRFSFFSLLSGAFAAVTLLPEIFALKATASAAVNFPTTFSRYFSIIDMFARHLVNVETEQGLDHWPNIYCGVAVIMLFAAYLLTKRIALREKAVYCAMLLVFFASFSINVFNFIWHGFHYPNSLPCRQSFIYIFLILYMCYRVYMNIERINLRLFGTSYLLAVGFILICEKVITAKHFHFSVFYISIIFVSLYALLIFLRKKRKVSLNTSVILLMTVVTLENLMNTAVTSITTTSREAYIKDNAAVGELVGSLTPSTEFFRIEKLPQKTKNDGAWMNFSSASLFSSVANADITEFYKSVGCEGSTNAYALTGSTPLINMLLSVKYTIYDTAQTDGEEKKFIENIDDAYLYQNNYSLSVGFMMPRGMNSWARDFDDPALAQDDLCRALGTDAVLVPNAALGDESGRTYTVTIGEEGDYYTYIKNPSVKKVSVEKGGSRYTYDNVDRGYLVELGSCRAGETIVIKSETDGQDIMAETYRFDYGALEQVYNKLSESELELTSWTDNGLKGNIDAGAGGVMFTSIPYDKGWSIKVDGKKVLPQKLFDSFIGIPLTKGEHYIEMSFMPSGLKEGALISVIAVMLMIITAIFYRIRGDRAEARKERDACNEQDVCNDQDAETYFDIDIEDFPEEESSRQDYTENERRESGDFTERAYENISAAPENQYQEDGENSWRTYEDMPASPESEYQEGGENSGKTYENKPILPENEYPQGKEPDEYAKIREPEPDKEAKAPQKSILDELSEELSFDFHKSKADIMEKLSSMQDIEEKPYQEEKEETDKEPEPSYERDDDISERFDEELRRLPQYEKYTKKRGDETGDEIDGLIRRLSKKGGGL